MGQKKLIIISHIIRFPKGIGASVRVANYSLGLSRIGFPTTVLCLKSYESSGNSVLNPFHYGNIENTDYLYTSGSSFSPNNKITRFFRNIRGLWGAFLYMQRIKKDYEIKSVLYYGVGNSCVYSFFGFLLSRLAKAPFIGEATEEPFVYSKGPILREINKFIFWRFICKLFDGVIVISRHLRNKFNLYVRKNIPIEIIPIMVDISKFNEKNEESENWVTYCGNFEHDEELGIL